MLCKILCKYLYWGERLFLSKPIWVKSFEISSNFRYGLLRGGSLPLFKGLWRNENSFTRFRTSKNTKVSHFLLQPLVIPDSNWDQWHWLFIHIYSRCQCWEGLRCQTSLRSNTPLVVLWNTCCGGGGGPCKPFGIVFITDHSGSMQSAKQKRK